MKACLSISFSILILGGIIAVSSARAAEMVVGDVPTSIESISDPRLRNALILYSPNYDYQSRQSQIAQYNFVYQQEYGDDFPQSVYVPQPVYVPEPAVVPESPAYYPSQPLPPRYSNNNWNNWNNWDNRDRDYRRGNDSYRPAHAEPGFGIHFGGDRGNGGHYGGRGRPGGGGHRGR